MKYTIDQIFLEVTGRDISQESQLEFHPHPSGTGHTFIYREYRKAEEGIAFDTPEEFRAKLEAAHKPAKKSATKKVVEKVKAPAKKAVKKVAKKFSKKK